MVLDNSIKQDKDADENSFCKKKRRYVQKYSSSWEHHKLYSGWLKRSSFGIHHAYCSVCDINLSLRAGITDLRKHARSKKHIKHIQLYSDLKHNTSDVNNINEAFLGYVTKLEDPSESPESEDKNISMSTNNKQSYIGEESVEEIPTEYLSQNLLRRSKNSRTSKIISSAVCEDREILGSNRLTENISVEEDEFDSFGRFVTNQLRKFPEKMAVELTLDIHDLIAKRRLKVIKEQNSISSNIPDSQVITVSLPQVYNSDFTVNNPVSIQ